jgi:hypothetical protein
LKKVGHWEVEDTFQPFPLLPTDFNPVYAPIERDEDRLKAMKIAEICSAAEHVDSLQQKIMQGVNSTLPFIGTSVDPANPHASPAGAAAFRTRIILKPQKRMTRVVKRTEMAAPSWTEPVSPK